MNGKSASKRQETVLCTACIEHNTKRRSITLPCSHRYCHPCVKKMVAASIGGHFPPRCCNQEIPYRKTTYKRVLGVPLFTRVQKAFGRSMGTLPTYCSSEACKEYIMPSNVLHYGAYCPCGQRTCTRCKQEMHRGQCKITSSEDTSFLQLASRKKWKRCPNCGAAIERVAGCHSVV
jgi:E3 ubiquitin-protein ligase RNF144